MHIALKVTNLGVCSEQIFEQTRILHALLAGSRCGKVKFSFVFLPEDLSNQ